MAETRRPRAAPAGDLPLPGLGPEEDRVASALTVSELCAEVDAALRRSFPRSRMLWVRGEIEHLSDRTGHCYIDLVDPEQRRSRQAPVLRVRCWRSTWVRLRAALERQGLVLEPGMVVLLRGSLDFYRPKAELSFILAEIDVTALLGGLAARRAALLATLRAEGLLDRNKSLPMPPLPQRIGLVASPGTEGYRDLLGQLTASGWAFHVCCASARVQGPGAAPAIVLALRRVAAAEPDLVVVVRGGGSKGDLAAFDTEPVARAVSGMPVPVWTGIGHSGDESVTDLVAHRTHSTPTACGKELVSLVGGWWEEHVLGTTTSVGHGALRVIAEAEAHQRANRSHLAGSARHLVRTHQERIAGRRAALAVHPPRAVETAGQRLHGAAARLPGLAQGHVRHGFERVVAWRRLVAAYDVERQLERGYTLTLDEEGRVLRSSRELAVGQPLVTRFADGAVRSRVEGDDRGGGGDPGP